ncbi:TetR/AcrR family transcriptional regulator [Cellulosimicrobium cellulans]|uniref:TetR/AcrR family transcriptional regulator n=1 Tax=Cellulosimicrobium cellulans TaxID=1710 RepID=UPI001EDC3DF6|nr:TetR/AcrR family transcriptional regulator [Cellulosimicrobium cellulans]
MRSAQRPAADAGPVASDLTTRARIRDAAIERFARDGFGASVRSVAADVGVSHALVVHHFGSKDGLRQVCDEHVLEQIRTAKAETIVGASSGTFLQYFTTAEQYATLVGYVLRSLLDGGPSPARSSSTWSTTPSSTSAPRSTRASRSRAATSVAAPAT